MPGVTSPAHTSIRTHVHSLSHVHKYTHYPMLTPTCYRCYYLSAYQEHNRIPKPCRPKGFTDADGKRLWRRFIALAQALPDGINPQEYLSQWFCNAPFEAIKRGNVEEMLTYGFFYKKQ